MFVRHAPTLVMALVWLSCQLAPRGARTSIYGLFSVPTAYYPYALIALSLIQGGPAGGAEALAGAVVGHVWWCAACLCSREHVKG
jgi:Derlin-2/3